MRIPDSTETLAAVVEAQAALGHVKSDDRTGEHRIVVSAATFDGLVAELSNAIAYCFDMLDDNDPTPPWASRARALLAKAKQS